MLHVDFDTTRFGTQTYTTDSYRPVSVNQDMMSRLAQLSQQQQWILYTAQCPRPQYDALAAHQVQCGKIIHMKPSQSQSELEIVMKAIQSGNASAIVASGAIDFVNQKLLQQLARDHQCEVFFLHRTQHHFH
ncbi:SulA-like leucine-rich domain-containing protein [Vibrio sp. H11]|uniref:SulA-like leucine-rich domain-containing protein n=1 Tax=Vibrio sp. H11 TaxID=2565928 RepID=UPI0010A602FE|nr:SulA-like leucine-rich domain-containing protein [Vibrio sp. H11]